MSSSNHALAWENYSVQQEATAQAAAVPAPSVPVQPVAPRVPALRVMPLLRAPQPHRFVRVPTHAVGVHLEQRERPRASLRLPLKLHSVNGAVSYTHLTLPTNREV